MCVFLYDVKVNSNHGIRLKTRISFFIRPSPFWLSLKRGFVGYRHEFRGCDRLGGLDRLVRPEGFGGFDQLGEFDRFGGLGGLGGFVF